MPEGSGVRFAEWTSPHGPRRFKPPAQSIPGIGAPRSSIGVWQPVQLETLVRYSPYFSREDRSGGGTDPGTGRGRSDAWTGGGSWDTGILPRTGGIERRYAITAARSSSHRSWNRAYGIIGKRVRPSFPIPCRIARANCSSVHFPLPVSGQGEMLGATSQGRVFSGNGFWPPPSVPGFGGIPSAAQSIWE